MNKFLDSVFYFVKTVDLKEVKIGKHCGLRITNDSECAVSLGSSLLRLGKDKILQHSETRLKMGPRLSLESTELWEKCFLILHT